MLGWLLLSWCVASPSTAWTIDEERSVFAVLTHKAGVGARLAHDHVIHADGVVASLDFDPAAPEDVRFTFEASVARLVVDDPAMQQGLAPFLEALDLLDDPFETLKEKSRRKIRTSMLGVDQLDADRHETLSARIVSVEVESSTRGGVEFSHRVGLSVTIRGMTVEIPVVARFVLDPATKALTVDAVGDARFTDFGIEPYRAMLGAVRNDDTFQIIVRLHARP